MKMLALLLTVASLCLLAACESTPAPAPAAQTSGTSIGGGFHASGAVETGGSLSNR